ncbi:MAG: hypothetical protein KDK12_16675 [Rhodobacteraceae bacterium]|nr:hypothetical protein [Paracoccaceae bacterium]
MSDDAKPIKSTLTDADISTNSGFGRRAFLLGTFGGTTVLAGCVTTGITDADPSDPVGNGRGGSRVVVVQRTGITDADPSDPVGNGRGRRVCTDADTGYYADPARRGRRC